MPTYDYICSNCSYKFEEYQRINDPLLEVCPNCAGKIQRKIGGGGGLLFKGTGFYITDYKNNKESTKKESKEKKQVKESSKKEDPK